MAAAGESTLNLAAAQLKVQTASHPERVAAQIDITGAQLFRTHVAKVHHLLSKVQQRRIFITIHSDTPGNPSETTLPSSVTRTFAGLRSLDG